MSIYRSMAIRLAGTLFVVGSLSGCGGGGGSGAAITVNPADVVGTWKMVSHTPPGGSAVDVSSYNITLVSDALTYTIAYPLAIPGNPQAPCTEYGTWSISGNNLTTTPIAGSTCDNPASTQTLAISGTTMTMSDADGTGVFQRQTATPVTGSALVGTWKMMAKDKAGTVTALNQSNVTLDLGSANYTLTGISCSETGTWSISGSALNFVPAAAGGTCGNSVAYSESASLNDPLVTLTDAVAITIWEKLLAAPASPVANGTNGAVSLSWQAVSGATGYKVYRATASGALAAKTVIANTGSTSYQDTAAVAGTTYYYQITAVSAVGESLPSAEVNGSATAPPSPVTGLIATPGTGQVFLAWNAVSGATSYKVYGYSTGIGMCKVFAPNMGTGDYSLTGWGLLGSTTLTNSTIINTTAGICYQFMVTAVNTYGESLSMSYVNATPQ